MLLINIIVGIWRFCKVVKRKFVWGCMGWFGDKMRSGG